MVVGKYIDNPLLLNVVLQVPLEEPMVVGKYIDNPLLLNVILQVPLEEPMVVGKYIDNPLLINGHKEITKDHQKYFFFFEVFTIYFHEAGFEESCKYNKQAT